MDTVVYGDGIMKEDKSSNPKNIRNCKICGYSESKEIGRAHV